MRFSSLDSRSPVWAPGTILSKLCQTVLFWHQEGFLTCTHPSALCCHTLKIHRSLNFCLCSLSFFYYCPVISNQLELFELLKSLSSTMGIHCVLLQLGSPGNTLKLDQSLDAWHFIHRLSFDLEKPLFDFVVISQGK